MKMAMLLLVHNKPNQLNKYLNQLISQGNMDIFIHVNKKNEEMSSQIIKHPQIHIISKYDVKWGSFEIVQSCIFLMEKALEKGGYDFLHFGSGQDLMIKPDIFSFLSKNRDKIFIRTSQEETDMNNPGSTMYTVKWPRELMDGRNISIQRFLRVAIAKLQQTGLKIYENKKRIPNGFKVFIGGTWFTMPVEVAEYVTSFLKKTPEYVEFFYNALAPDTMFFQTILMNSKYRENIEDELTYVKFGDKKINANHPVTITKNHIKELESSNKFFARKFDENVDSEVIDYFVKRV